MFRFICKSILHSRNVTPRCNPSSSSSLFRYFSSDSAHIPHSFTVSYLTQTCGLSPKSALSASKTLRFESSEQPDSVVSCFQKYGFSKSNISQMITKFPNMLCCNPQKTISPKLDFFRSKGLSPPEIVTIFTVNPWILRSSLGNTLVRTFNILIEMLQSEHKAIQVIKQSPHVLYRAPEAALIPNANSLRENGVPESSIMSLILNYRTCILTDPVRFQKILEEVKQLSFSPLKLQFVEAIMALTVVTKLKWDGRVEVYKKWGWSDNDITTAFKKFPRCMTYSVDNIDDTVDFYVNKLGVDSSYIVNHPTVLSYSLKKRIIPRGAVIQYLSSKGLVKLDSCIYDMVKQPERRFLEKYVECHEEAPHLMKLYNDKLNEATDEGK